ncbi:MAG: hypothetical protein M5U28_14490 [Sandaracinaceae bacterium]|nr:hypothetical protein [Sandaracinaceae bacterium]
MTRTLGALALWLALASAAEAQGGEQVVVLVVDSGTMRVNVDSLGRAISGALSRPVVRMTDDRAQTATGRLTIAFSNPNRWVLRYEANGQVAWVSDRITRPGELRGRLAELSQSLVTRVETAERRSSTWGEDVILALQNEIVDPFADSPEPPRSRPVTVLWSEVVDPFRDQPPRAQVGEVWSEVLDPWAAEARRR